jgi:single-strand DNA-binding protein
MAGLNKVMLIGNVGKDPEMRYTANGKAVTTFSLACNRTHNTPEGERREETDWFDVVTWDKLAELCSQFLQKGRQAYVEGRLQTRDREGQTGRSGTDRGHAQTVPSDSASGNSGGAAQMDRFEDAAAGRGARSTDDLPFE